MIAYVLKRTFILFLTLILVSMVIFAVLMVIPGDPAQIILGTHATPETLQALRHKLGLDRPVVIQYLSYMKNLGLGDMGRSIHYDVPIRALILSRLQVTIPLTILSMGASSYRFHGIALHCIGIGWELRRHGFSQIGLAVPASGRDPSDSPLCRHPHWFPQVDSSLGWWHQ